jgi:hypothetical protein
MTGSSSPAARDVSTGSSDASGVLAAMQALLAPGTPQLGGHPATIPLHLQGDTIVTAAGSSGSDGSSSSRVLLERLNPSMLLNPEESRDGVLVFGGASQTGPSHFWDLTIGSVSVREQEGSVMLRHQRHRHTHTGLACALLAAHGLID